MGCIKQVLEWGAGLPRRSSDYALSPGVASRARSLFERLSATAHNRIRDSIRLHSEVRSFVRTMKHVSMKESERKATNTCRRSTVLAGVPVTVTCSVGSGVPNKPMVPTAPIRLTHYAPGSLRRHIGQPLAARRRALVRRRRLSGLQRIGHTKVIECRSQSGRVRRTDHETRKCLLRTTVGVLALAPSHANRR